jgi:large conductance mechanosensitive channel
MSDRYKLNIFNKLDDFKSALNSFKNFVFSETIIFFGVAGVISIEFVKLVKSIINDVVLQLFISISGFDLNFDQLKFHINGTPINYGLTLTYLINFLIILILLYVVVIAPFKRIQKGRKPKQKECQSCLNECNEKATKCMFCLEHFEEQI